MTETITPVQDFEVAYINPRDGVTVDFGDGRELEVPPHSERVYLEVWKNGIMEVIFYQTIQPWEDPSDRIHLMVTGFDIDGAGRKGFIMNVEDAIGMVHGLSTAIQRAIEAGVPLRPEAQP